MQDLAHRDPGFGGIGTIDRSGRAFGGFLPQRVGEDHGQDDGGRLHQCHGSRHMTAVSHVLVFQVLDCGDKGHRAHRAISGGHGCGVKPRDEAAQQGVADQRNEGGQRHGGGQTDAHLGCETGL